MYKYNRVQGDKLNNICWAAENKSRLLKNQTQIELVKYTIELQKFMQIKTAIHCFRQRLNPECWKFSSATKRKADQHWIRCSITNNVCSSMLLLIYASPMHQFRMHLLKIDNHPVHICTVACKFRSYNQSLQTDSREFFISATNVSPGNPEAHSKKCLNKLLNN